MIWGGGGEVLLDGIKDFAAKVGTGFSHVHPASAPDNDAEKRPARFMFIVTPRCAHEEMIIDELTMDWVKGREAAKEVEKWLSAVLS